MKKYFILIFALIIFVFVGLRQFRVQEQAYPDTVNKNSIKLPENKKFSVKDFGAKGDGKTDDTAAIQKAINATSNEETLFFSKGTYVYSKIIAVNNSIKLSGYEGAILKASNPDQEAIILRGNKSSISGFKLTSKATQRGGSLEHHRIVLDKSNGSEIKDNIIDGGRATGIFAYGAKDYLISGNTIENTLADAIHNTFGSQNGIVVNNIIKNAGDDGIAVVSYVNDKVLTKNILIERNQYFQGKARGISVVGGENIKILNNKIEESSATGIYLASEDYWNTYAAKNITVENNKITKTNTDVSLDHAAIFVYARPQFLNENLLIRNNTIEDTLGGTAHITVNNKYSSAINIIANIIFDSQHRKQPFKIELPYNEYNLVKNIFNNQSLNDQVGNPAILP